MAVNGNLKGHTERTPDGRRRACDCTSLSRIMCMLVRVSLCHAFKLFTHDQTSFRSSGSGTSPTDPDEKPCCRLSSTPLNNWSSHPSVCHPPTLFNGNRGVICSGPRVYHVHTIRHLGNNPMAPMRAYLSLARPCLDYGTSMYSTHNQTTPHVIVPPKEAIS